MRLWLSIFSLCLAVSADAATTYYVDWTGGSDLNDGLSTVTAWKRHPYMANSTATYVHAPGDTFIFKGGETWPTSCYPWHIMDGGGGGLTDTYSYDAGWFTGASFSAPVFDAGGVELPGGYDVMVLFDLAAQPHDITLNGLHFTRLYWSGNKAYAWVAFVNLSVSYNVTLQSCQFLNWSHAAYPTTDQLKVVIGANSSPWNPGCILQSCTIDGQNAANSTQGQSSGEATYAYSGNVIDCTIRNIASGTIVTGDPLSVTPQVVSGCEIGPAYMSYDPGAHPDGIFMNGGNLFWWHDNLIHDCWVETVFAGEGSGAEKVYLWNNVIWGCKTSPAVIENNLYAGAELYVWNNTIDSGSFYAIRNVNRGNGSLGVLDMRNNLFITDAGVLLEDAGSAITSLTNANNVVLDQNAAWVLGYTSVNQFQPRDAAVPTVEAGQDLSSVLGGLLTTDLLGVTRPKGPRWDAGAYEWNGVPEPVLRTPIMQLVGDLTIGGSVTLKGQ